MFDRNAIQFGDLTLPADRPFLIAEAGVNHENDLRTALRMVDEAALAGADAIKFQSYKADRLAAADSPAYWDTEKEPTQSQRVLFQKYDSFDPEQYETLAKRAEERGILFLTTPFDVLFLDQLGPLMPVLKVASADITNFPLLRRIAQKGKPVILSTGASTLADIDEAVRFLRSEEVQDLALLHCVLSYPTNPEDANLNSIPYLQTAFPESVIGYSDHLPPAFGGVALTAAWMLGARIIETHFTLDKSLPGNDHYHALDGQDLREFRNQCDYVTSLMGTSRERMLVCEGEARQQARRSLVADRRIARGETIQAEDVTSKRPGTGIEPRFLDLIVGARAISDIAEDQVLKWEMLIDREPI